MLVDMPSEVGRGVLACSDGEEWGPVDYTLWIEPSTPAKLGSIRGRLKPVDPSHRFHPFFKITMGSGIGHLRMEDGRWWVCIVQGDGRAVNNGGIRDTRPEPRPNRR
jgi:hypothetical protein